MRIEKTSERSTSSATEDTSNSRELPVSILLARGNVLGALQAHITQLVANCDEVLCDLLIGAHSDSEQALYYESMKELRSKNDTIISNFVQQISQSFDDLLVDAYRQRAITKNEKISLVESVPEDDEVAQYMDLASMVSKARADNLDELDHLKNRIEKLIPGPGITDQNNPLDPASLWQAFKDATAELNMDIKARVILLKQFDREVIGTLPGLYASANQLLIQSGTLPNLNFTSVAPVPINLQQTRLSTQLLKDLTLKHVFDRTVVSVRDLCTSMALSGPVVEQLIQLLRDEALVELSTAGQYQGELAFRLTDRGRFEARDALSRSGYSGPAPVALEEYAKVVEKYSISKHSINREQVYKLFDNFVIEEALQDQLGAALNSHRAIFIYGPPGTGKTYTMSKLCSLYGDACLIPYAIASGESIIQLYDPQIHKARPTPMDEASSLRYAEVFDTRYVPCDRPVVVVGGELTLDQLEVNYQPETRLFQAPLQLKANNGLFIIDDMGRQAVPPKAIFNRWIVPMEDRRDFLSLASGQHFEVPFDVQLVFSSNINPYELADDAFLRRIGFKILFDHIDDKAYIRIWKQELEKTGLAFEPRIVDYLINDLHRKNNVSLAPCHPRDILNTALSQINYLSAEPVITEDLLDWAWDNYFVHRDLQNSPLQSEVKTPETDGGHHV